MLNTEEIQEKIRLFAREREWEKFHTPKNIASALSVEVAELLEHFQWLTPEESQDLVKSDKLEPIKHEVADVAVYLLRLCDLLEIDLEASIKEKMALNAQKYPVEKCRGKADKYNKL